MDPMILYPLSTVTSFGAVSLKGFQSKNIIGNHLKSMFITSYLIAAFDVATISLVVLGGWPIALSSGTGAAFGMLFAVKMHDKIFINGGH